jgi:nitrogen PTS system EIIA component
LSIGRGRMTGGLDGSTLEPESETETGRQGSRWRSGADPGVNPFSAAMRGPTLRRQTPGVVTSLHSSQEAVVGEKPMVDVEHFSAADVIIGMTVKNKGDLLEVLANEAASRLGGSRAEILDALEAREKLSSKALGNGVALPHAQIPGAVRPVLLFARLTRPIDYDARDAEPVDLVFLVVWPAPDAKGLLNAMSEFCRALRDPHMTRRLRLAQSSDEVVELLRHPETPPGQGATREGE